VARSEEAVAHARLSRLTHALRCMRIVEQGADHVPERAQVTWLDKPARDTVLDLVADPADIGCHDRSFRRSQRDTPPGVLRLRVLPREGPAARSR
jgi:hypothetical protein